MKDTTLSLARRIKKELTAYKTHNRFQPGKVSVDYLYSLASRIILIEEEKEEKGDVL